MGENGSTLAHEEYRCIWMALSDIKKKLLRLENIKAELSNEKFTTLSQELIAELNQGKSNLNLAKKQAEEAAQLHEEDIKKIKKAITGLNEKTSDLEILSKNEIIDELQFLKEQKNLEHKKSSLEKDLLYKEKLLEAIEMVLKFPDPEQEANEREEIRQTEIKEREEKERIEKEKAEAEKQKELNIKYQIETEKKRLQGIAQRKISEYEKEKNELQSHCEDLKKEIGKQAKTITKLTDDIEILNFKNDKTKKALEECRDNFSSVAYSCGDLKCQGVIGLDGTCKSCGRSYFDAKKYYQQKMEYIIKQQQKINKKYKIAISVFVVLGLILGALDLDKNCWLILCGVIIFLLLKGKQSSFRKIETTDPASKDIAQIYDKQGLKYFNQYEYDRAINYYTKALGVWVKCLGKNHPDLAVSHENLGISYYHKNDFVSAIRHYKKSLKIRQIKSEASENHEVAALYNYLGLAFDGKGEHRQAIKYFQKALNIFVNLLGEKHTTTLAVKKHIQKAQTAH